MNEFKIWFNAKQAGEYIGISQPTLRKYVSEGILPSHTIRGRHFFNREEIDAAILSFA